MSFGIFFSGAHHQSKAAERKVHLGLELLEERNLLSASAAGVAAGGLLNDGGGQAGSPGASGAPPVTTNAAMATPAVAPAITVAPDPPGSLSGYVFLEPTAGSPNFNPVTPAPGELPVAGATVRLSGPGGTQSVVTTGTGAFDFSDLTPGNYSLSITPPSGDTNALAIAGSGNGTAGIGTISNITIGSGQNQTGENFAVTAGSQLGQIYFTASLLVSGGQIPLAPFEQVITPAPTPNVPQQIAPPTALPGLSGRTFVVAGSQSLPQGGSGGDAIIGGANPASPLYAGNIQDEIWPAFGEQGVNNWLNEGPEADMMQQLNNLGDMNLLNGGTIRGTMPNPNSPIRGDGTGGDGSNRGTNNNLFNFHDGELGHGIAPDIDPLPRELRDTYGPYPEQAVLLDRAAVAVSEIPRLPAEEESSPISGASAAAVAAWMLVTSNRRADLERRADYFERRRTS